MTSAFDKTLARNSSTALDELNKKILELDKRKGNTSDDRFWSITKDESGNGTAIIRFLPAPACVDDPENVEDSPFIRYWNHYFKGPSGKVYYEKSLTTIGKDDPVYELNRKLWNTKDETLQKQASNQKRKVNYVSNIYVIKDPANPENNGKVFLFRYGTKIFNKIQEAMYPELDAIELAEAQERGITEDDLRKEKAINVFNFFEGSNFKLKVTKQGEWPNYDGSEFLPSTPLLEGDVEKLKKVFASQHSLADLISEDKFKDYKDLDKKLNAVLEAETRSSAVRTNTVDTTEETTTTFGTETEMYDDEDDETADDLIRLLDD